MNKIEELEAQLMAERIKVQIDLINGLLENMLNMTILL